VYSVLASCPFKPKQKGGGVDKRFREKKIDVLEKKYWGPRVGVANRLCPRLKLLTGTSREARPSRQKKEKKKPNRKNRKTPAEGGETSGKRKQNSVREGSYKKAFPEITTA